MVRIMPDQTRREIHPCRKMTDGSLRQYCLARDQRGGRALPRPVVPKGAVSLVAVLLSTRSKVVRTAMSIAIITATAKSKRAVWWLFRSFLMRESPLIVVCAAYGSVWLVLGFSARSRHHRSWGVL